MTLQLISDLDCDINVLMFRWDGISAMYANAETAPVRVALEMRLTGSSNVVLAPQRSNDQGTVSIEILTTLSTDAKDWAAFMQQVTDKWTGYAYPPNAHPRPHWAKQWSGLNVKGMPIEQYFKELAYKEAIQEFKVGFGAIVTKRGGSVDNTLARFGNTTMQRLLFQ